VPSATRAPASQEPGWDWASLRRRARAEARRLVADEDDAEDAAQEAMVRAWRRRLACRSPEAPERWVRTIARNEALRQRERSARAADRSDGENGQPEVLSDGPEEGLLRRLSVEDALAGLTEEDRRLVRLRYALDLSDVAIGELMGIAGATVRVRLHRIRKRLQGLIEDPQG
jgi:RNA polymerase sigma-70 factor (ECF subfamily)